MAKKGSCKGKETMKEERAEMKKGMHMMNKGGKVKKSGKKC